METNDVKIDIDPSTKRVLDTEISTRPTELTSIQKKFNDSAKIIFDTKLTQENYLLKINQILKLYNIKGDILDIYNYINSNFKGKLENTLPKISKEFTYMGLKYDISDMQSLGRGSFNNVYRKSISNPSIPNIVIRISKSTNRQDFINAYAENLKHLILYLVNRCNIGQDFQLFPQPLFMGIGYTGNGYNLVMIMEAGDQTVLKFLDCQINDLQIAEKKNKASSKIKRVVYSLFNGLSKLNQNLDYFIHGDSKINNFILKDGKIMIIDLGFSKFKLYDLVFGSSGLKGLFFTKNTQHNVNQDLIQFLSSFFISTHYNGVEKRRKRERNLIINLLNQIFNKNGKSKLIFYNLFKSKVRSYIKKNFITDLSRTYKIFYDNNYLNRLPPGYSIDIIPEQMKIDFGISDSEELYSSYKNKYEKYKRKYLKLKQSLRIE